MRVFLIVPRVKKYQIPVFVILVSKNLSTTLNCCHRLRMVNVSFQGEISLHSDLPSLHGYRVRNPLLRGVIRIPPHWPSMHSLAGQPLLRQRERVWRMNLHPLVPRSSIRTICTNLCVPLYTLKLSSSHILRQASLVQDKT